MPRTKHKPAPLPELGPFKQTVQRAGFAYTTMRDQVLRGNLSIVRIGRSWYIETEELRRFIQRNTERMAG